ncbi:hypothetical protein EV421DRAFT_1742343 [Armillaria borealis]|uniref:Uncharacterized protein n=1 Tax=Armillaria borealis TaxID=47425 RepID=A0AA39J0T4_9AGAR|nr:hypothetical protein EV421DRAFT_1742343 [Armillaria borealis]
MYELFNPEEKSQSPDSCFLHIFQSPRIVYFPDTVSQVFDIPSYFWYLLHVNKNLMRLLWFLHATSCVKNLYIYASEFRIPVHPDDNLTHVLGKNTESFSRIDVASVQWNITTSASSAGKPSLRELPQSLPKESEKQKSQSYFHPIKQTSFYLVVGIRLSFFLLLSNHSLICETFHCLLHSIMNKGLLPEPHELRELMEDYKCSNDYCAPVNCIPHGFALVWITDDLRYDTTWRPFERPDYYEEQQAKAQTREHGLEWGRPYAKSQTVISSTGRILPQCQQGDSEENSAARVWDDLDVEYVADSIGERFFTTFTGSIDLRSETVVKSPPGFAGCVKTKTSPTWSISWSWGKHRVVVLTVKDLSITQYLGHRAAKEGQEVSKSVGDPMEINTATLFEFIA